MTASDQDNGKSNEEAEILNKVENPNSGEISTQDVVDYLSLYADKNAARQQEAVDLLNQRTDYNKGTLRELLKEQKSQKSLRDFEVKEITKIVPINGDDETTFQFHIDYDGETHEFKVESSELVNPTTFKQRILELTDQLITFDSWHEKLNEWMESTDVQVREEEPLKDVHAVVEHIFEEFEMLQFTKELGKFKNFPDSMAHVADEEDEVHVSGRWIDNRVESLNKDVSKRKVRQLLDPFMPDGSAKKVRKDDDQFRAWRFKKTKLEKLDVITSREYEENDEEKSD